MHFAGVVVAESPGEAIIVKSVDIGFNRLYKVGEWAPLRLVVEAPVDCEIVWSIEVPDADDSQSVLPSGLVRLAANAPTTLEGCFKTGRIGGDIRVRIQDREGRDRALLRLRDAATPGGAMHDGLRLDTRLVATLGHPAGFGNAPASVSDHTDSNWVVTPLATAADLPSISRAYDALDALFLADEAVQTGGQSLLARIQPVQSEALRDWVRCGGRLVVVPGVNAEAYLASPLAKWLPIEVLGATQVRQLNKLEVFAGRNAPLAFPGAIPTLRIAPVGRRNVLVDEIESPLIVRVPYGLGHVTVSAIDLDRPPLAAWPGLSAVCHKMCDDGPDTTRQSGPGSGRLTHLGITDMASQLNAAQDEFPEVRRLSHWSVLALILLYIVMIGPVDYLLVHRVFRKPVLTWVTFPTLICAASGLAVWAAGRVNGDRLLVNQFDLLDTDVETRFVRGQTWFTLYSPESRRYRAAVAPIPLETPASIAAADAIVPDAQLSWTGIPENAVGGLYRSGGLGVGTRSYHYTPHAQAIEDLPISQWSTKSLHAVWTQDSRAPGLAESRLESHGAVRLSGGISHRLTAPLTDCLLVYAGRVYFPLSKGRTLAAFQDWEPAGPQGRQLDLKSFLTDSSQFKAKPYNPLNHDRFELLQMLTFYHTALGASYTGLAHAALRELELTPLTQLGRAVLVGRFAAPGSHLVIDDRPREPVRRDTFVRIILPVRQTYDAEDRIIPKFDP